MSVIQHSLFEELDKIFNKYRNKKVTVLHSGGLDSNVLVGALYLAGADVNAVAIRSYTLQSKTEQYVADEFIRRLKETPAPSGSVNTKIITIDGEIGGIHRNRFSQMSIWLNMLPLVSRESDDSVCIGYVIQDQALSMVEHLKRSWKSQTPFLTWGGKLPSLDFPLMRFGKNEILAYFVWKCKQLGTDKNLPFVHWYCESNLEHEPLAVCGKCCSCKRAVAEGMEESDISSNLQVLFETKVDFINFLNIDPGVVDLLWDEDDDVYTLFEVTKGDLPSKRVLYHINKHKHVYTDKLTDNVMSKQEHLSTPLGYIPSKEHYPEWWYTPEPTDTKVAKTKEV